LTPNWRKLGHFFNTTPQPLERLAEMPFFLNRILFSLSFGVIFTFFIFSFFFSAFAQATQIIAYSDQEMVEHSALIVWARVVEQRALRVGKRGYIATESSLRVRRIFKGQLQGDLIFVRTLGGNLGGQEAHVEGAAKLRLGEEVLIYLESPKEGVSPSKSAHFYYVTGMGYGVWRLRWSSTKQEMIAHQQDDLPPRLARLPQGGWHPLPPAPPLTLPLPQIAKQIQLHLATLAKKKPSTKQRLQRTTKGQRAKSSPPSTPQTPRHLQRENPTMQEVQR
jgi:hypothetical protein